MNAEDFHNFFIWGNKEQKEVLYIEMTTTTSKTCMNFSSCLNQVENVTEGEAACIKVTTTKSMWLSAGTHIVVVFNQVDNVGGVIGQFTGCRGLNDVRKFLVDGKLVLGDCKDDADWLLFQLCRDLRDAGVVLVGALCVDVVVHVTVAVVGQNNSTKLQQEAELQRLHLQGASPSSSVEWPPSSFWRSGHC